MKHFPSRSIPVSVSELRSATMSLKDAARLSGRSLSSNAFFNTRARKLHANDLLSTRPAFHELDEAVRGHVF
jgi:hypothetical protein